MKSEKYFHSVRLLEDKCKGCTHCIRTCPTQAIRVRNGKARIMEERCIDCGECIRTCPNNAKIAVTDPLEVIKEYKHTIAIPAPSFAGQFSKKYSLGKVLSGFLKMGFDEVVEVGLGADLLSKAITEHFGKHLDELKKPVISSACPAVVRLIQVKYPGLVQNILPMQSPMEVAARYAREHAIKKTGFKNEEIGVFFISPCPAKVTAVKQPSGVDRSYVNGVIAIKDMVNFIKLNFQEINELDSIQKANSGGISWGRRGGEAATIDISKKLAVDGIHHVSKVLEKVEEGGLRNTNFIEAQACVGGCVGGVLMVEDPFMAGLKLDIVSEEIGERNQEFVNTAYKNTETDYYFLNEKIEPRPITRLDPNVKEAMRKLKDIEEIDKQLPGIDCGACGCPTCRAFAEDVVAGLITPLDCQFILRKDVGSLAEKIFDLAKKLPHTLRERGGSNETD
ncbi:MAG TPA: [Fe-Fe] hydrogenase large subunit C-terminal domain-containing protein [bacterium]|nr:[Fe-Fe] hydrogenase large subunit C-terminal domain-containing protein [bacterium]